MHLPHWRAVEEELRIDFTALLDVVFILLIFFVASVPLVHETGMAVSSIRPSPAGANQEPALLLTVAGDDGIWLDGQRIDVRRVRARLERLHALRPQAALVVRVHEDSATETFAAIADQARQAGIYDVALVTSRQ